MLKKYGTLHEFAWPYCSDDVYLREGGTCHRRCYTYSVNSLSNLGVASCIIVMYLEFRKRSHQPCHTSLMSVHWMWLLNVSIRNSIRYPTCKKIEWCGVGVVLCLWSEVHGPADATATPSSLASLWLPWVAGADNIFSFCGFFFFYLFSSPNLSRQRLDVYHTSTHDLALVRI